MRRACRCIPASAASSSDCCTLNKGVTKVLARRPPATAGRLTSHSSCLRLLHAVGWSSLLASSSVRSIGSTRAAFTPVAVSEVPHGTATKKATTFDLLSLGVAAFLSPYRSAGVHEVTSCDPRHVVQAPQRLILGSAGAARQVVATGCWSTRGLLPDAAIPKKW